MSDSKVKTTHLLIDETRRTIIDAILARGNLTGDKEYYEFAKIVCPSLSDDEIQEIARHMDRFHDWPESYLLNSVIDFLNLSDKQFMLFLEGYVNLHQSHQDDADLVEVINSYIAHDGFKLKIKDTIGDKNFYECISTRVGVRGQVKNIIFAAKYKPEIALNDALNNDIRITKNENECLVYNRSISSNGLMWSELVDWYADEYAIKPEDSEKMLIKRLCECLDTSFKKNGDKAGPETLMLEAYCKLKRELGVDLPALIPQVYLYYDPQTLKQRKCKLFEHQKMDFLMLFSHKNRVVIEIDGKQHYAEGNMASPKLYSEMMRAQREMSLCGYDVYRFGGYEFTGAESDTTVKEKVIKNLKMFFRRLFNKYGVLQDI